MSPFRLRGTYQWRETASGRRFASLKCVATLPQKGNAIHFHSRRIGLFDEPSVLKQRDRCKTRNLDTTRHLTRGSAIRLTASGYQRPNLKCSMNNRETRKQVEEA